MTNSLQIRLTSPRALAVAVGFILAAGSALGVQFQVFLDRASWEQAAGGAVLTENFDAQPVPPRYQLPPGVSQVGLLRIEVQRYSGNLIAEGSFIDTVNGTPFLRLEAATQNGSTPPVQPILWFSQPVQAFGADFNFVFPPRATIAFNDQPLTFSDYIPGKRNGFFGIVSAVPFDHVQFDVVSPFNTIFNADNVSFAPVPEPSALAICLVGFAGLSAVLRRGRRSLPARRTR